MTDKQLGVLLDGLMAELVAALSETETLLANVSDEREQMTIPVDTNGEKAVGLAATIAFLAGATRLVDNPDGRFLALSALDALCERWDTRFSMLTDGDQPAVI